MAKSFNLTAQINLQGPANIKPVVAQIKRELGAINTDINIKFDPKASKGVDSLSSKVQTLNRILIETNKNAQILSSSLNGLGSSIKGLNTVGKLNSSVAKTAKSIQTTAKVTKQASSEMVEFGKQSALAIRRFAAFSIVSAGVFSLVNAVRTGSKAFIEFDKQLIKLEQITGGGSIGIKALKNEIISLATTLGVSSESLTEVASTLAQAGFSARETQQALAALAKTELAPSFDNLTDTTEGAIAAIRQFGIETKDLEKVLGSINAVAAAFAVESSDIITAIQRAGGAFAASSKGVSEGADALNEFIAIFTSVRATTRESAETIATGLRTIFTRIQRGSTIKFLREFGVELTDIEGKFVGPYKAIERLSTVLNTLDPRDLRFSQIVEELGGFRQISKVIPLIQQFGEAQKALGVAQRGQGSLSDAQIKAQQSLANQLARVREEFLALTYAIGDSATFRGLFKLVLGLTSGLLKLTSVFKPLLPLIATLGVIKGGQAITKFASGFLGGIKKGGGVGSVGTNIGEQLSGASSEKKAIAAEKTASALIENTKSLTTLTTAVESLTQAINSRGPGTTLNSGGLVKGFARGGYVPGSGNTDTVPAMLTPGEFVIRKKAVETIGANNLQKMNKYGLGGSVELTGEQLANTYASLKNKVKPEEEYAAKVQAIPESTKSIKYRMEQLRQEYPGFPNWKLFEYAVAKKHGLKLAGGNKFLDFPSVLGEAKFLAPDATYARDKETGFLKGNNDETMLAKLVGSGQYKKNATVRAYYPANINDFRKFAGGGKALGARPSIKELDETELAQLSTTQLIKYANDLAYDVFTTGGAGMAIGSEFIEVPKEKIIPELESSLVSYMGKRGFWREKVAPFGKAIEQKTMDQSKIGREAALESQVGKYADEVAARAQEWTSIRSGSTIDNYLMQSLEEPILSDYQSSKAGQPLAKTFHATRLRQAVNKALDEFDDFDYSGSNIDKLVSGMAAKRFAFGGPVSSESGFEAIKKKIMDQYPDINFRISKRKGGFGYNLLGGLKQEGDNTGNYAEFKQASNLSKLQEVADNMASSLLYEYGPNIDPSLLKKMRNKRKFAKGGSTQDTVPALLTPGEFVINKEAAQKIGYSKLHQMNKADKLQGYNKGGIVGGIQKFADGGDVTGSKEWLDIIKQMTSAADTATNVADFLKALEDIEKDLTAAGKIDLAKQLKLVASSLAAGDGDALTNSLTSSKSGRDSLRASQDARLSAFESLSRLTEVLDKNIKVQELFAASAQQAGISVKEFEQNIKNQILEKSLTGEAGRKSSRLDLRKEFAKTRVNFSANDLRDADNQQKVRESLQTSLAGLLDPTELNDAIDEIIYGLGTGATSLEEIAAVSPEVAKALDSSRDRIESLSKAHKDLEDELGGLTDSVKVAAAEMEAFDYKKSGQAQKDFGGLGNINPGGALAFKNSRMGSRLLGAAQNFQQTGGLGKLPLIGKGIGGLSKALENLPGPIGSAIKAVGGLPGAFAAVASIIGSEVLPQLLKAVNMGDSEIGAGISGALAEGGSRAASMGALGNQLAGPIGGMIGVITGALSGAIDGLVNGLRTKKLENSIARLDKSIEAVDKAFENLAEKDNIQNVIAAQKSLGGAATNFADLQAQAAVSPMERAASATSTGLMGAGIGAMVGLAALIAGIPTGGFGTAAVLGGAAAIGGGAGIAYGAMKAPDELDDEALQASLKAAEKYIEGLNRLAERDIKLKNLSQLEEITSQIDQINKDLATGKIGSAEAEALKKNRFIQIGAQSAQIENAQRSALINSGINIRPDKSVAEQIVGNDEATRIANAAAEQAAYIAGMDKLKRQFGDNTVILRKESADRQKVIALGREELGMQAYQMAAAEKLTRLTKDMARETEALAEAYNRALAGIGRFKEELDNMVMKIEENAAFLTGEGGMGRADRTQENMLKNMKAYTSAELAPVLNNVQALAGGGDQGKKLTDTIKASQIMQEKLPDILRNTTGRNIGEVIKQIDDQLAGVGIGESVRNTLVKELESYLEKETANRSGDSFQEILANFPALADAIDSAKKAQEVGIAILEAQNDALDAVNQQLDQYNKYLRQSLQWSIKADQIRLQGAIELDRALGRDISLERLNAPFENEIRSLTQGITGGAGTTDPVAIAEGIRAARARDEQLRGTQGQDGLIRQAMNENTDEGRRRAEELLQEQADLARASQDAYEALEKLATNGDVAANILGKIEAERQQGKNVIEFVRKISTQSAEDAVRMQRSFKAFDLTMKGQLNLGNRENRQLAYEGMDSLLPLLKGSEAGNQIINRFTKQMLVGQGVDINKPNVFGSGKSLSELIDAGTTGIDPGTQKLIDLYNKSIGIQQTAATELSRLNGARAQQHLNATATILNNLYNNLPIIIASALANPQGAAAGQVAAPRMVADNQLAAVPIQVDQPLPVVVQQGQNAVGGGPVVGPDVANQINQGVANAVATVVPKFDLTILNSLNNGIIRLNTTIGELTNKFTNESGINEAMISFGESTSLFGTHTESFREITIAFGNYVDNLSEAASQLSNAKITMGGNYTVDVRVSGAAAFQSIEEKTQQLINKEIGLAMDDMINKIKKATGMSLDLNRREP